jgi:hypothetical protein
VGLIEAHQQLWLLLITHLGELFIELGDGGPQRMPLIAQHIPELHRAGGKGGRLQSQQFASLAELRLFLASGGQAGEVALHVGLQAMAVGEGRQQQPVNRARRGAAARSP